MKSMDYVRLGRSGLKVSRIGLGCMSYGLEQHEWRMSENDSRPFFRRALDIGINFFDTADMYGDGDSEAVVGRALVDYARRDDVVIATKIYYPVRPGPNGGGLSRKAILTGIDASLRRLKTDYVDLYQIHRWDDETPIEETLEALHLADRHGWTRFVSMQPHYNLLNREEEREMLPLCRSEGIGVLPWSPLARGRLARAWQASSSTDRTRYDRTAVRLYSKTEEADKEVVDALGDVAANLGVPRAQVSLAWLLHRDGVACPIVGATKPHHLDDALAATTLRLDEPTIAALEQRYVPHAMSFSNFSG